MLCPTLWKNLESMVHIVINPNSEDPEKWARDGIIINRIAVRSPTSTTNKIRSELLRKGTIISKRTIRLHLSLEFGLKSCKPARKPRLTERMISKLLAFAHKYDNWSPEQWVNVIFLDKSTVQQLATRQRHVWKP